MRREAGSEGHLSPSCIAGSCFWPPSPQAWTDGRDVVALVAAHPTRQEDGLLPFIWQPTLRG